MLTRLRRPLRARRGNENGAIAIMSALLVIVLFSLAALTVDLGNAFARRTDTQTQADYGALAAAAQQKETAKKNMTITTAMKDAVATAMNNNQPQDDKSKCWTTKTCVTAAQLTDGNLLNGEIRYCGTGGPTCGANYASGVKGLQVIAPRNKVDYGFANFLGVSSGYVTEDALVNVFTAGKRVMPMYAVQGCDYGLQTLADPANGHTTPVVPTLAYDSDTNTTSLTPISQVLRNSSNTVVSTLTLNSTGNSVRFEAKKWVNATKIGFFRGDDPAPGLVQEVTSFHLVGNSANLAPYTQNNLTTVELNIPDAVAQTETVWWIRVYNATTGQWSPKGEALGVRVGQAVLECDAGSNAGNFGTLKFPRTDVPTGNELPANIALGLQAPLTPEVHQWAVANPTLAGLCTNGVNGAVVSSGTSLLPGTNCVDTDTGLAANTATEGLVQGGTYGPGVLTTEKTRCDRNGSTDWKSVTFSSTSYNINNDVLSCYFVSGSTSIADIAKASYNGGIVLDPSILSSPRFFYVPVLAIQPATGGSQTYSIIDFRAAFLTDETATSTAIKGSKTGTNDNGVIVQGQDIKQLKVVFFNSKALPVAGNIPLIDYLGAGERVIRLLD
jgi:Flp pilus assembly protein TadG